MSKSGSFCSRNRQSLQFPAEGEVAGVAEAGDDVGVAGEFLVDGGDPEGDFISVALGEVVHGVGAGDGADEVDGDGIAAFLDEFVDGDLDGGAGGQHRVGQDEGLAFEGRGGAVVRPDFEVIAGAVFAEGCEEGGFGVVEEVEDAFLERQAGPEDGGDHERSVDRGHAGGAEGRYDVFLGEGEFLGDLIREDLSDTLEVGPEAEAVFLNGGIAHLCDEVVENGRGLSEIDDFHGLAVCDSDMCPNYKYRNLFRFANPFVLERVVGSVSDDDVVVEFHVEGFEG